MKRIFTLLVAPIFMLSLNAQTVVKLWPNNPPTNNDITEKEIVTENLQISNVSIPELTIYSPEKTKLNGSVVVICPGGGYARLAAQHEGTFFAKWLNERGYVAAILKYRMPNKHKEVPLDDAWQAIRYVRDNAKSLGINPNKVGIAGFSAGGHLAATASTHFATEGTNTRPDFSLLFYPVITMDEGVTHQGSKTNLLGDSPSLSDLYLFSNEKQVNSNTPPTLLMLSDDDRAVLPENSIRYYQALKNNGIKSAMYIFPVGGHGWGFRSEFKYHSQMTDLLENWLKAL